MISIRGILPYAFGFPSAARAGHQVKILENELLRSREDLRKANDRNSDLLTHFGKQVPLVHIFSWFF